MTAAATPSSAPVPRRALALMSDREPVPAENPRCRVRCCSPIVDYFPTIFTMSLYPPPLNASNPWASSICLVFSAAAPEAQ